MGVEHRCIYLEDENMPNPSKILGHVWDNREDTLKIQVPAKNLESPWRTTDIVDNISPTMAEGKHIYREACEEKKGRNAKVEETA
jgi:hypothetical protein